MVIGRAQRAAREVNLAACAASGVPVLRRASGGGTVYQDLGNLNISLAVPGRAPGLAADLAALVAAVIAGLGLTPAHGERGRVRRARQGVRPGQPRHHGTGRWPTPRCW